LVIVLFFLLKIENLTPNEKTPNQCKPKKTKQTTVYIQLTKSFR